MNGRTGRLTLVVLTVAIVLMIWFVLHTKGMP